MSSEADCQDGDPKEIVEFPSFQLDKKQFQKVIGEKNSIINEE
jgi:hypothetical protein